MRKVTVEEVRRIERLVGGEPEVEAAVMAFVKHHYGIENLLDLHPKVAAEIRRRPLAFIQAAKEFLQPGLRF